MDEESFDLFIEYIPFHRMKRTIRVNSSNIYLLRCLSEPLSIISNGADWHHCV